MAVEIKANDKNNKTIKHTPKTKKQQKPYKWDLIKCKSFFIAKEIINRETTYKMGENGLQRMWLIRLKYTNSLYNNNNTAQSKLGRKILLILRWVLYLFLTNLKKIIYSAYESLVLCKYHLSVWGLSWNFAYAASLNRTFKF